MLVDLDNNEIQVSHHLLYGEEEEDITIPPSRSRSAARCGCRCRR